MVKKIAISFMVSSENSGKNGVTNIPIPIKAKELFKARENQLVKPLNVPMKGPMLLLIKKYAPPAFGIAVASSVLASIAGIINNEANR